MTGSSGEPKRTAMCRSRWLRRQRAQAKRHGSKGPPCQQGQGDISEVARNSVPVLELDSFPEDIVHHIHSLMPLRDAARAACASRTFLRSWRCYPNLTFNWATFGLSINVATLNDTAKKFVDMIHRILENHSGTGLKTLNLDLRSCGSVITANQLDIWLQAALRSGIVQLAVHLPWGHALEFNFPCSLLPCAASSLQSFSLSSCAFRPTLAIGCFRKLKSVCLRHVRITDEELGCLLSCTVPLEELKISECDGITFLRVPSHLQHLSFLRVFLCKRLQRIEINALKVSNFWFRGPPIRISISDSSQLKCMTMNGEIYSGMFHYALTMLHSIASNVQTLNLLSSGEAFDLPAPPEKFLHLRNLRICYSSIRKFDFISLVSFLKACPALESFFLSAGRRCGVSQDSILEDATADPLHIRRIPEFRHDKLKKVSITWFCSARSLVELTLQILESSSSLQSLVLDTTGGYGDTPICGNMDRMDVMEALKGVEAIERYVKGKVPSSVYLEVLEPCDRCHIPQLHRLAR